MPRLPGRDPDWNERSRRQRAPERLPQVAHWRALHTRWWSESFRRGASGRDSAWVTRPSAPPGSDALRIYDRRLKWGCARQVHSRREGQFQKAGNAATYSDGTTASDDWIDPDTVSSASDGLSAAVASKRVIGRSSLPRNPQPDNSSTTTQPETETSGIFIDRPPVTINHQLSESAREFRRSRHRCKALAQMQSNHTSRPVRR